MSEAYDRNSFNANTSQDDHPQDGEAEPKLNEKAGEYVRELLSEKVKLNNSKFPLSMKLISDEVSKVQAAGRKQKDNKYMDVYHEKPVKVVVKVLVPIKEHPKFNFMGKLLGPKGNNMKQLQEETMCKMAVLGRGSMRDKKKEEELRQSLDPKYAHLSDELHVEISALAPPSEAHARMAFALSEVKKCLTPDPINMYDNSMRQNTMRPMMERGQPRGPPRGPPRIPPPIPPQPMPRMPPAKSKVMSILDRVRSSMEAPAYGYDDSYGAVEPPVRGPAHPAPEPDYYDYERGQEHFYEDEPYYKEEARDFKANTARDVGTRRPVQHRTYSQQVRSAPYARPSKPGVGKKRGQ